MLYYMVKGNPCNYAHGELFTEHEMRTLDFAPPFKICEPVYIKKNETFFSFGCRFPIDNATIKKLEEVYKF